MILRFLKLTFSLEPEEKIILPAYKGSSLRGGFGSIFRKTVCVLKKETCLNCLLRDQCAYSYIFETSPLRHPKPIIMEKYEAIPKPFVIEPPKEAKKIYEKGERINFSLILIGRATNYVPYFVMVFNELGKVGLGQNKGKFRLREIWKGNSIIYSGQSETLQVVEPEILEIPDNFTFDHGKYRESETILLEFITPLRIKYQRDLVVVPEFHILIRNITRRLWLLNYFHIEKKEPDWNHKQIIESAKSIKTRKNMLRWFDWERYSGRQKTKMLLGGLIGKIIYEGNITPFLPFLRAGEIIHVGKGTAFGLGEYRIQEVKNE